MPIEKQNQYKTILSDTISNKDFVSEALGLLESNLWEISLLALQDWANTQIPSPDLFHSITALQRPSWGVWNGLFDNLRKVRTKALRSADTESRRKIDQAIIIKGLLQRLDDNIKTADTELWFKQLRLNPKQKIPHKLTLQHLLSAPITLRNRIAHDTPTTDQFWQESADVLRKLLKWLDQSSDLVRFCQQSAHLSPWFIEIEQQQWRYNGINPKNNAVLYVSPQGESQFRQQEIATVLLIFQQLMGKTNLHAKDFRRLLGKLAPEEIKGVFMGDYLVGKFIGEGAHGVVHKGIQLSTGRQVAIKFLKDQMSDEVVFRFKQEGRFLSRFTHPHIVSTYHAGEDPWVAPKAFSLEDEDWYKRFKKGSKIKIYIAMQWIEGQTLEEIYQQYASTDSAQRVSIDFAQLSQWFIDAATALEHVHQSDIIHRDIKPSNLMIDENGNIKIMDFGIARSYENLDARLTRDPKQLGTPAYMSPEQITAKNAEDEVGPAADVYGLCAVFYELYTQHRLFNHSKETTLEEFITIKATEKQRPKAPTHFNKKIPWELDIILSGGLENSLKDRYKDAKSLKRDLLHYQRNEPIEYQRPSLWRRTELGYRRNRRVVNIIGMATLAIIVLSAVSFYRITEEKNVAEAATVLAEQRAEEEKLAKERAKKSEEEAKLAKVQTEQQLVEADHNLGLAFLEKAQKAILDKSNNIAYMFTKYAVSKLKDNTDEKYLALSLLNIEKNQPIYTVKPNEYHDSELITAVKYSPNGSKIATLSGTHLKIWDSLSGNIINQFDASIKFNDNLDYATDFQFTKENEMIIFFSNGVIYFIDLFNKKIIVKKKINEPFSYSLISPNGKFVAVFNQDKNNISIFDTYTTKRIFTMNYNIGINNNIKIIYSADSRKILVSGGKHVKIIDVINRVVLFKIRKQDVDFIFSPKGDVIAQFEEKKMILINSSNGMKIREIDGIDYGVFSPNGKNIAVPDINKGGIIYIFDIASGKLLSKVETREIYSSYSYSYLGRQPLVYSPKGKILTFVSYGKTLKTIDISSEKTKQITDNNFDNYHEYIDTNNSIYIKHCNNYMKNSCSVNLYNRKLSLADYKSIEYDNIELPPEYLGFKDYSLSFDKNIIIGISFNAITIINSKTKKILRSMDINMDTSIYSYWNAEQGRLEPIETEIDLLPHVEIISENEFAISFNSNIKIRSIPSGDIINKISIKHINNSGIEEMWYNKYNNTLVLLMLDYSYIVINLDLVKKNKGKKKSEWINEIKSDEKLYSLYLDKTSIKSKPVKNEHLSDTLGHPHWPKNHIEHWLLKLEKEPNNSEYMYEIGLIYDRDNNYYRPKTAKHDDNKEALKWYKKAIKAGSKKAKKRLKFLKKWMKAQKDLPKEKIADKKADLYQDKIKKYKNLIKAKNTALKKQPNNTNLQWDISELHLQLGNIYKEKEDRDTALQQYKEAVKIRTKLAKKYQGSSKLQQGLKQSLDKIQKISPEN